MTNKYKKNFNGHIVNGVYNIPQNELFSYIPELKYIFRKHNLYHDTYIDFKLLYGKIKIMNDFESEYIYTANNNTYCICEKLSLDELNLIYDF